jgi:hypothetical protein
MIILLKDKIMTKKIVASLVLSYIFIGCGSSGESDLTKIKEVLKLSDIVFAKPQKINFQNKMRNKLLKINALQEKVEISSCGISGTIDIEELSDGTVTILYKDCINYSSKTELSEYYNGKVQTNAKGNQILFDGLTEILDYENYPKTSTYYDNINIFYSLVDSIEDIKINGKLDVYEHGDVVEKISYSDFTIKTNLMNRSYYMAGYFSDKTRCYAEEHLYKTENSEWLVEDTLNSRNWSSGTLYIDNVKYVYDGESVTVTKNNQQKIFTQQELRDEYNKNRDKTDCFTSYI